MAIEYIEYRQGDTALQGFLATPEGAEGKRPAVLIVHDWMGEGPYVERRAREIAGLGYVAFAADIYGKDVRPKSVPEAIAASTIYKEDRELARKRVKAALETLLANPLTDAKRVAAIGYCFGGLVALELARSGAEIAGVAVFHAGLDTPTPEDAKHIKAKVLAMQGGDDPMVPPPHLIAFMEEMRGGGVDWQLVLYGDAVHSFSHPEAGNDNSKGAAYNEKADRRSWRAMVDFFQEIFANGNK